MSGTKPSQTPAELGRMISVDVSQWLKSPMTETLSAFGAQTANCTPRWPFLSLRCAPSFSYARVWVPSASRYRSNSVKVDCNMAPPLHMHSRDRIGPIHLKVIVEIRFRANPTAHLQDVRWQTLG